MPDTTALQALTSVEVAYLFVIEGSPVVWTTGADLVGTTYMSGRTVRPGLALPSYSYGIDISQGTLEEDEISIEIDDIVGDLVSLFATEHSDEGLLGVSIEPGDTGGAETYSMHVGTEAFGSAGERGQYPVIPGYQVGKEHVGGSAARADLPAAPVSDSPVIWAGRRCALYQVFRDHVTYPDRAAGVSSWRPWTEGVRVWWGTLRDAGQASIRSWRLRCDGPSSWLRKPLGLLSQLEPVVVEDVDLQFDATERKIGILIRRETLGSTSGQWIYDVGEVALSGSFATGDYPTVTAAIASAVSAAVAATGPDGEAADYGIQLIFNQGSGEFLIRGVETPDTSIAYHTVAFVTMHEKAWRLLGYAPELQSHPTKFNPSGFPLDSKAVRFAPAPGFSYPTAGYVAAPSAGYWSAAFGTRRINGESVLDVDNDANPRIYQPQYSTGGAAGTITLLAAPANGGQEIEIPIDSAFHRGQLDRPPGGSGSTPYAIAGVGNVDRQGLWLFSGPRVDASDPTKVYDYRQIARCSWKAGDGNRVGSSTLVVHEWLDPRLYGIPHERMAADWVGLRYGNAEDRIQCRPLHALAYRPGKDHALVVLQRLLLGTGTATGWYTSTGYGTAAYGDDTAYLEAGANDPAFAGVARDADTADLGLGIPASMVAAEADWSRQAYAVSGDGSELVEVKVAFVPGAAAEDVIRGIIDPIGLQMTLRGGRYGVFSIADDIERAGVDATLGETDVLWDGDRPPTQEIRAYQPIDSVEFEWDADPETLEYGHTQAVVSRDRSVRYRPGGIVREVKAPHWRTLGRPVMPNGILARWGRIARFWERRHFWVRDYPVLRTSAIGLYPGSFVSITDARLVSQAGAYGVSGFVGCVTRVSVRNGEPVVYLDVLVHASSALGQRVHAPMAQGIGWDASTNRIYCADDFLGLNDGTLDVSDFVEPSWSAAGGSASIKWFQWDGYEWAETGQGTVSSVSAVSGASYIQLSGAPSGAYYRNRDTIVVMREHANQAAAWVKAVYAPVCDSAGEYGGTQGYRFRDA